MIWLNSHWRIVSLYVRGTLRKKFCPWQRLCSSPSCSDTFEGDRNNVVDWFIHVKASELILAIVNSFLDIHCDQWCGSSCEFKGEWMNEFYEEFRAFESWTKKQECSAVKYNVPPPTSCSGTGNCVCKPEIEFSTILSVMSSRTICHGQILTCPAWLWAKMSENWTKYSVQNILGATALQTAAWHCTALQTLNTQYTR